MEGGGVNAAGGATEVIFGDVAAGWSFGVFGVWKSLRKFVEKKRGIRRKGVWGLDCDNYVCGMFFDDISTIYKKRG